MSEVFYCVSIITAHSLEIPWGPLEAALRFEQSSESSVDILPNTDRVNSGFKRREKKNTTLTEETAISFSPETFLNKKCSGASDLSDLVWFWEQKLRDVRENRCQ